MKGVSLQGYNSKYVTMLVKGELRAGDLVAMGGNNTVEKAVNKRFVGVAHAIRDGYALVQTGGFAVLEEVEMVGVGGQELVEYRVRFVEERKAKGWS